MFYNSEGHKILPDNLESILTPRGLAYWIMDDGYNSVNGFYICSESFTLSENQKLVNIFKNIFNLNCGVHKHTNGYRLYIFSSSKEDLLFLIKPVIIKHFYYKFNIKKISIFMFIKLEIFCFSLRIIRNHIKLIK